MSQKVTDWHGINLKETASLDYNEFSTTENITDEEEDIIHRICCINGNLVYELISGPIGALPEDTKAETYTIRVFHLHSDYYYSTLLGYNHSNIGTKEESWAWVDKITEKYGHGVDTWKATHTMF